MRSRKVDKKLEKLYLTLKSVFWRKKISWDEEWQPSRGKESKLTFLELLQEEKEKRKSWPTPQN